MSYSADTKDTGLRSWWWLVMTAIAFVSIDVMWVVIEPDYRTDAQVCDAVVQTLLTTRDPIELQRAGILAGSLHCDVSRRAFPWLHDRLGAHPG